MACRDAARTPYPLEWREDRAILLAAEFEAVRAMAGHQPVTILSCYRTPAHNRLVGGARRSQHLEGRALDLQPPMGMTLLAFHARIVEMAAQPGCRVRGIGLYPTFVHIDIRPTLARAHWTHGARRQADVAA